MVVGIPWGFSDTITIWPGTAPDHEIWDPYIGGNSMGRVPSRMDFELAAVPGTRVLPNGTKIDKFQGYDAPVVYPHEVWNWTVRQGQGHLLAQSYGGATTFSNRLLGGVIGLYVVKRLGPTLSQIWTARGRMERIRASADPQFGADYVLYTAEIERLTDYQYVSNITLT
jgi:hypothetical protein